MNSKMSRREDTERHESNEDMASQPKRAEEHGEADEPDAPTSGEENEGMSTILSAEPLAGVQDNESEE
jgi:hypothetical protein